MYLVYVPPSVAYVVVPTVSPVAMVTVSTSKSAWHTSVLHPSKGGGGGSDGGGGDGGGGGGRGLVTLVVPA